VKQNARLVVLAYRSDNVLIPAPHTCCLSSAQTILYKALNVDECALKLLYLIPGGTKLNLVNDLNISA
jgi:hypothetical protein